MKKTLKFCFVILPAFVCAMLMKPFYRNVWFIYECGKYARDNGYWFFKYMIENHPEQKVVFCVSFNSPDYKKVKELGKVCNYRSFSHYFYYFACGKEISTHPHPNKKLPVKFNKTYFLQHGVIRDYTGYVSDNYRLKLFVTSAYKEDIFIKENYGYDEKVINLLGLARHDNLIRNINKNDEKIILIMPTWRKYLANISEDEFKKSDYYLNWSNILSNKKLLKTLEKYDKKIIFYPHREMQRFVHMFTSSSNRIIIADIKNYDVQELLIKASLMITDYSSVFFDFAYMKKPVIWYLFDEDIYHEGHHCKGYFKESESGLGEISKSEEQIVLLINKYIKNNFKISNENEEKINNFFAYFDGKNCERIYKYIKEN